MEKKTERSNCHFAVQQASDGKPILVVQLYQDAMPILSGEPTTRWEANASSIWVAAKES
jgi:hypothetical protein